MITLLAATKLVCGFVWLVLGLGITAYSSWPTGDAGAALLATVCLVLGAASLACAYGLWTLREYGRVLQIALSLFGLLVFPLQTVISVMILIYMFKPGARVLFSGTPVASLSETDRDQLLALESSNVRILMIAVAFATPLIFALMGVFAAIAIPSFLAS